MRFTLIRQADGTQDCLPVTALTEFGTYDIITYVFYRLNEKGTEAVFKIDKKIKGRDCTMALTGQLDSTTAVELDEMLKPVLAKADSLTIDCTRLAYVSSAGLRVLLMASKTMASREGMVLTNLTDSVRRIFDVTGMTELFTIR